MTASCFFLKLEIFNLIILLSNWSFSKFWYMIYNSFHFLVIYPFLFLAYYLIPARFVGTRNLFLLLVSYLLYMNFNAAYALILIGVQAVT